MISEIRVSKIQIIPFEIILLLLIAGTGICFLFDCFFNLFASISYGCGQEISNSYLTVHDVNELFNVCQRLI